MLHTTFAKIDKVETEDLLPRWMKSVIARQPETAVPLPFQRARKKNEGLLPAPRPSIMLIMARIADR